MDLAHLVSMETVFLKVSVAWTRIRCNVGQVKHREGCTGNPAAPYVSRIPESRLAWFLPLTVSGEEVVAGGLIFNQ